MRERPSRQGIRGDESMPSGRYGSSPYAQNRGATGGGASAAQTPPAQGYSASVGGAGLSNPQEMFRQWAQQSSQPGRSKTVPPAQASAGSGLGMFEGFADDVAPALGAQRQGPAVWGAAPAHNSPGLRAFEGMADAVAPMFGASRAGQAQWGSVPYGAGPMEAGGGDMRQYAPQMGALARLLTQFHSGRRVR